MTTIAFDGKTLAADTCWQSAYRQQHATKKISKKNGVMWGSAGAAVDLVLFDQWMQRGSPHDDKPALEYPDEFSALVIRNGEAYRCEGKSLTLMPAGTPSATGSGCNEAMGAMMAGASAKRAVEIAIKLDSGSGGKVNTIACQKKSADKRRKPNNRK